MEVLYTAAPEDSYLDAAITAALQAHCEEGPGDVLVFLTGQEEIESCHRLLLDRAAALPPDPGRPQLLVLPIYAALPPEQQLRVFQPAPAGARKVVLATNIAETSITITGVRYVVDTGFVKARSYSPRLGADCLQVTPISQAQARQRSGRAGREAPGKAFRLYTEDAFQHLPAATLPEIQRTNLSSTVLQARCGVCGGGGGPRRPPVCTGRRRTRSNAPACLVVLAPPHPPPRPQLKAMGISDVLGFEFMDAPPRAAMLRSLELLLALGALDMQGNLTPDTGARACWL